MSQNKKIIELVSPEIKKEIEEGRVIVIEGDEDMEPIIKHRMRKSSIGVALAATAMMSGLSQDHTIENQPQGNPFEKLGTKFLGGRYGRKGDVNVPNEVLAKRLKARRKKKSISKASRKANRKKKR